MKKLVWPTTCFTIAILAICTAGAVGKSDAANTMQAADTRSNAPAALQPDFGQLMTAYGNRFVDLYFAAEGGNWGLARYEIDKMRVIEKMGAASQPKYAARMTAFDGDYLQPLEKAVDAQEWSNFQSFYQNAANGCNACHAATGRAFIRFKTPFQPIENHIDFQLESEPGGKLKGN